MSHDQEIHTMTVALAKLHCTAKNYVRCARPHSGLSPYIKENGLYGGSPWTELCDAVAALETK